LSSDFTFDQQFKLVRFAHPAKAGLEYWNDGILGFVKMGKWDIGNISLENVVKSMHKKINSFKNQSR